MGAAGVDVAVGVDVERTLVAETSGSGVSDGTGNVVVGDGVTSAAGSGEGGSPRTMRSSAPASQKLPSKSPVAAAARIRPPMSCRSPIPRRVDESGSWLIVPYIPASGPLTGRMKLNVLPTPILLSTQIRPPCASTSVLASDIPTPVSPRPEISGRSAR